MLFWAHCFLIEPRQWLHFILYKQIAAGAVVCFLGNKKSPHFLVKGLKV